VLLKGERLPNMMIGGYDLDMVQNTAFARAPPSLRASCPGRRCRPESERSRSSPERTRTTAGRSSLDKNYDNYDPYLDKMKLPAGGIVGSII